MVGGGIISWWDHWLVGSLVGGLCDGLCDGSRLRGFRIGVPHTKHYTPHAGIASVCEVYCID